MNTLNRRDYTDTPDHDDACMVCDKIDCICPPETFPVPVLADTAPALLRDGVCRVGVKGGEARESTVINGSRTSESSIPDSRGGENSFDLEAEIDRQRALGYETFDDYITRTGFPRDEASYAAFIGEGHWMLTSKDQAI